jgi:hypothetical protein
LILKLHGVRISKLLPNHIAPYTRRYHSFHVQYISTWPPLLYENACDLCPEEPWYWSYMEYKSPNFCQITLHHIPEDTTLSMSSIFPCDRHCSLKIPVTFVQKSLDTEATWSYMEYKSPNFCQITLHHIPEDTTLSMSSIFPCDRHCSLKMPVTFVQKSLDTEATWSTNLQNSAKSHCTIYQKTFHVQYISMWPPLLTENACDVCPEES